LFISELIKLNKNLETNYNELIGSQFCDFSLIRIIDNYLSNYIKYYDMSSKEILDRYTKFLSTYKRDLISFISTGKYPFQLKTTRLSLDRISYDLALILSTMTTLPRHQIMLNLMQYSQGVNGKTLIIGLGSGLELEILSFVKPNLSAIAYDNQISDFVISYFQDSHLIKQNKFIGDENNYNSIFAIELLEHLDTPYELLKLCSNALVENGELIITTATNIPQFDHLYNFNNQKQFYKNVNDIGLRIKKEMDIFHDNRPDRVLIKNTWYILEKLK